MGWVALLTGIVKVLAEFAGYLGDRQLISAGEAQAVKEGLHEAIARMAAAKKAAAAGDSDDPDHRAWADRVRKRFDGAGRDG
jgi:hypothetical protein